MIKNGFWPHRRHGGKREEWPNCPRMARKEDFGPFFRHFPGEAKSAFQPFLPDFGPKVRNQSAARERDCKARARKLGSPVRESPMSRNTFLRKYHRGVLHALCPVSCGNTHVSLRCPFAKGVSYLKCACWGEGLRHPKTT